MGYGKCFIQNAFWWFSLARKHEKYLYHETQKNIKDILPEAAAGGVLLETVF